VTNISTSSGGKSEGFGLNLDKYRRELGQDVHRHVAKLADAKEHQRRGDNNH
jgi:hypothetical protein